MKTFCICLPEYPDKIERAKKYFDEQGLKDVEFFWSLHADTAGLATWHTYEIDAPGSGYKMGANPTGIWLAHWMLWNTLAHLPYNRIMVLENDVQFCDGWKVKLENAIKDAPPDFDFLYVGSCCVEGFPKTHIKGEVYETKHIQCTHAYIIRRGCVPLLLRTLRKCWAPIDIQLQFECFPHLKTYAVLPRIFSQFNMTLQP
jgi:GR25 family glycosyltransferase involved in LPS biosynthesis